MSVPITIAIRPDGTAIAIYDDRPELRRIMTALGETSITRASHVEPDGLEWTADMSPSGGGKLGPFPTRQAALTAERRWLEQYLGVAS